MLGAAFMLELPLMLSNSLGALFGGLPLLFGYDYNYPALVGAFLWHFFGLILCMFIL